jgi:hypothetical protein
MNDQNKYMNSGHTDSSHPASLLAMNYETHQQFHVEAHQQQLWNEKYRLLHMQLEALQKQGMSPLFNGLQHMNHHIVPILPFGYFSNTAQNPPTTPMKDIPFGFPPSTVQIPSISSILGHLPTIDNIIREATAMTGTPPTPTAPKRIRKEDRISIGSEGVNADQDEDPRPPNKKPVNADQDEDPRPPNKKPRKNSDKPAYKPAPTGEHRLKVVFESFGTLTKYPQSFGTKGHYVPDGLCGTHKMYNEGWRFHVHHNGLVENGVVRLTWTITNLSTSIVHSMTETNEQARRRCNLGHTISNRVFKQAMEHRASQLEAEMSDKTTPKSRLSNLKRLVRALRPKAFSEGLLAFGLQHRIVQDRMSMT